MASLSQVEMAEIEALANAQCENATFNRVRQSIAHPGATREQAIGKVIAIIGTYIHNATGEDDEDEEDTRTARAAELIGWIRTRHPGALEEEDDDGDGEEGGDDDDDDPEGEYRPPGSKDEKDKFKTPRKSRKKEKDEDEEPELLSAEEIPEAVKSTTYRILEKSLVRPGNFGLTVAEALSTVGDDRQFQKTLMSKKITKKMDAVENVTKLFGMLFSRSAVERLSERIIAKRDGIISKQARDVADKSGLPAELNALIDDTVDMISQRGDNEFSESMYYANEAKAYSQYENVLGRCHAGDASLQNSINQHLRSANISLPPNAKWDSKVKKYIISKVLELLEKSDAEQAGLYSQESRKKFFKKFMERGNVLSWITSTWGMGILLMLPSQKGRFIQSLSPNLVCIACKHVAKNASWTVTLGEFLTDQVFIPGVQNVPFSSRLALHWAAQAKKKQLTWESMLGAEGFERLLIEAADDKPEDTTMGD